MMGLTPNTIGLIVGLILAAGILWIAKWWIRRTLPPKATMASATQGGSGTAREFRATTTRPQAEIPLSLQRAALDSLKIQPPAPPAAAGLSLPDTAPLADLMYRIAPGEIALGVLPDGTLYTTPIYTIHHDIEAGDTGSGKSSSIHSKIAQYHVQLVRGYEVELYGADIKQELYNVWNRSALMAGRIGRTVDDALQILRHLVEDPEDGLHARQARYGEVAAAQNRIILNADDYARVTGIQLPPKIFYLDELNVMLRELKDDKERRAEMLKLIFSILQMGRSSRVSLRAGAQYLTADILDREASKQFVNRALLGAWDRVSFEMLFGGVKLSDAHQALVTGKAGRGVIKTATNGQPVPFQALWVDEADILEAISVVQSYRRPSDWQLGAPLPAPTSRPSVPSSEAKLPEVRREVAPEGTAGSSDEEPAAGKEHLIEGERAAIRQWLREGKGNEDIARLMFVPRRTQKKYEIIKELRAQMELERNILHNDPAPQLATQEQAA